MKINLKKITKPFIIAELSANHNGKIENIFKLIDQAKKCRANAIKIQSYTPQSMTLDCKNKHFYISEGPWKGNYLYNLYKKGTTPYSWHKRIFSYAKRKNILCFSSPFDIDSVKLLEKLKTPLYKIASFEINHIPLLEVIGRTKKPVIMSTGMAEIKDIDLAVKTLKKNGSKDIAILHCISSYPSKPQNYNLNFINILKKYNLPVGLSDHTIGNIVAITSVGFGVNIFEKHIKLDNQKGLDTNFSTNLNEFKDYVNSINLSFSSMGKENFDRCKLEGPSKKHRRSIFISSDVVKNDIITEYNIAVVRPSNGLHPKFFRKLLGKKFKKSYKKGIPLKLSFVS
jgi:pseudaminic acid synthase